MRLGTGLLVAAVIAVAGCSSDGDASDESAEAGPVGTEAGVDSTPATDPPSTTAGDEATDTTGAASKAEPARVAADVAAPAGVQPEGVGTATVRVTSADGEVCDVCVWSASTSEERNRGLMGVTDLGEPVGMLFVWDERVDGNFFMFGTPMPLSIAWFDSDDDGAAVHVGQTDMAPCLVDVSGECTRYNSGASYRFAIEMVQGELDVVGIGPGSTIEVIAEHDTCPAA